jgi:hypothetical protein
MMRMIQLNIFSVLLIVFALTFLTTQLNAADDSIIVSGKSVIFFAPSQAEYDVLSKDSESEIDEILSDFYYYIENLIPSLDGAGLEYYILDHDKIQIELTDGRKVSLKKTELGNEVGMILTNGKKDPKVVIRLGTDFDMWLIIKEFFCL